MVCDPPAWANGSVRAKMLDQREGVGAPKTPGTDLPLERRKAPGFEAFPHRLAMIGGALKKRLKF
jgi:hypothetical protein